MTPGLPLPVVLTLIPQSESRLFEPQPLNPSPAKVVAKASVPAPVAPRTRASKVCVVPLASDRSTGTTKAVPVAPPAQRVNPQELGTPAVVYQSLALAPVQAT